MDEEDCFFYDQLRLPDGYKLPLKARSVVGLLPPAATTRLSATTLHRLPELNARLRWLLNTQSGEYADVISARQLSPEGRQQRLLAMVGPEQLLSVLARMLDPEEFLSAYGIRTLSRAHLESLNVEYPTGSRRKMPLSEVADDLSRRLIALFVPDSWGRRPIFGANETLQTRPDWKDLIVFPELPRRQRGGPRRVAPNRLVRPGGGLDPHIAPLSRAALSSTVARKRAGPNSVQASACVSARCDLD